MDWPIYFKDQLLLGDAQSPVGICALWTLKELIAKEIGKEQFSVCGQLYSKQGIKYILRNILANPRIRFLLLCGKDKSSSGQALLQEFKKPNPPDADIPDNLFALFQKNVKIIDLRGEINSQRIKRTIEGLEKKTGLWMEPKLFKQETILPTATFPTDPCVFKLRYPTVAKAWPWILKHIMKFGVEKKSDYGVKQKELINLAAVIYKENPEAPEFADYFDFNKEEFEKYAPQILTPEPIEDVEYTYGQRLRDYQGIDQIQQGIIERLKSSIDSRRALACTWQVEKDIQSKSPPCVNLVQALVQNNLLHLTVYIRSNDMFKAWPQNALGLRRLQNLIAKEVKTGLGALTTISCSAHIYEQDFERAKEIIKTHANELRCEWDPRGNFVISLNKQRKEIIAGHYSPDGRKINEYHAKTAAQIFAQIDKNLAVSQISHAFDLGIELHKAETALKLGKKYKQDHPLLLWQ